MTDKTIDLDEHRGMAAQKATDLRRLLANVEADQSALRLRQDELEAHLARGASSKLARSRREGSLSSQSLCRYADIAGSAPTKAHRGCARRFRAAVWRAVGCIAAAPVRYMDHDT